MDVGTAPRAGGATAGADAGLGPSPRSPLPARGARRGGPRGAGLPAHPDHGDPAGRRTRLPPGGTGTAAGGQQPQPGAPTARPSCCSALRTGSSGTRCSVAASSRSWRGSPSPAAVAVLVRQLRGAVVGARRRRTLAGPAPCPAVGGTGLRRVRPHRPVAILDPRRYARWRCGPSSSALAWHRDDRWRWGLLGWGRLVAPSRRGRAVRALVMLPVGGRGALAALTPDLVVADPRRASARGGPRRPSCALATGLRAPRCVPPRRPSRFVVDFQGGHAANGHAVVVAR